MNHYEAKKLIKDGNVHNLEEMLLNGEGYKLIGHYSTNPKIKTFLQSVPIYIVNICILISIKQYSYVFSFSRFLV